MKRISRNEMRAAMLALCALTVASMPARAQDNSTPPASAGEQEPMGAHHDPAQMEQHRLEMMSKQLNLTSDQVTQMKAIDDAQRTQMMALHEDTSLSREGKHSKMMAMRQDRESKIRALLTDEQKQKYDAMRERRHDRMENHQGAPASAVPPAQ